MVGNNFPKLGLIVSMPYAHRYTAVILNTSSRQGMPGSTTARMQEVEQRMEQLPRAQGCECLTITSCGETCYMLRHCHPWLVDPGIPCRDDGITQTLVYKDECNMLAET